MKSNLGIVILALIFMVLCALPIIGSISVETCRLGVQNHQVGMK